MSCLPSGLQGIHQDSGLYSSGELRSYEQVRVPTTWAPTTWAPTWAPTTWVPTTELLYPLTPGSPDLEVVS